MIEVGKNPRFTWVEGLWPHKGERLSGSLSTEIADGNSLFGFWLDVGSGTRFRYS